MKQRNTQKDFVKKSLMSNIFSSKKDQFSDKVLETFEIIVSSSINF